MSVGSPITLYQCPSEDSIGYEVSLKKTSAPGSPVGGFSSLTRRKPPCRGWLPITSRLGTGVGSGVGVGVGAGVGVGVWTMAIGCIGDGVGVLAPLHPQAAASVTNETMATR